METDKKQFSHWVNFIPYALYQVIGKLLVLVESFTWLEMSVVTVQLGQCGNQVGQELFDVVCSDAQDGQRKTYSTASCERFFRQTTHGGKMQASLKLDKK